MTIIYRRRKPFKEWLLEKTTLSDFKKQDAETQRKTFLWWKHGLSSDEANEAAEASEEWTIKFLEGLTERKWQRIKGERRELFELKLKWHRYCKNLWQSIQTGSFYVEGIPDETDWITREFNGEAEWE